MARVRRVLTPWELAQRWLPRTPEGGNMFDNNREIMMRLRLNKAESEALAKLTAAKDMGAAAIVRQLIVRAANAK
jgi:hypothetical protein